MIFEASTLDEAIIDCFVGNRSCNIYPALGQTDSLDIAFNLMAVRVGDVDGNGVDVST